MFLGQDACFRMKQKECGFNKTRHLGTGWAYFIKPELLAEQLARVLGEPEIVEVRRFMLVP
jgi:hypothetical protein